MQSYDEKELIKTETGDLDELNKSVRRLSGKATHHVIGRIPQKGTIIEVNGLKYKVVSSDAFKGNFRAKILKPSRGRKR